MAPLAWGRCTKKETKDGTTLYLTVFNWPTDGKLVVPGLKNAILYATLLANGAKLKTSAITDGVTITLPVTAPDTIASVIKIEVKGKIDANATAASKKEMKSGAID